MFPTSFGQSAMDAPMYRQKMKPNGELCVHSLSTSSISNLTFEGTLIS